MDNQTTISFQDVTLQSNDRGNIWLYVPQMDVFPGSCALLQASAGRQRLLADAATGLSEPERGRILYQGREWRNYKPQEAATIRGRIGRVFSRTAWISNLDVEENIFLAQQYHTSRRKANLREEAGKWAKRFGMGDLPHDRPTWVPAGLLQKSQWVRAFLGEVDMLVLEDPTKETRSADVDRFVEAVTEFCARGGTVMWMTEDEEVWNNPALNAAIKFKMIGAELKLSALSE